MSLDEKQIEEVVRGVVNNLIGGTGKAGSGVSPVSSSGDGLYSNMTIVPIAYNRKQAAYRTKAHQN